MDGTQPEPEKSQDKQSASPGKHRSSRRWLVFAGMALFLILAISFSTRTGGAAQDVARSAKTSNIPSSRPFYGVDFINAAELLADEQQFANGLATGATWDRYPLYWFFIEKSAGNFDWSRQDAAIQATIAHGLQLNAILLGTPGFYTSGVLKSPSRPYRHPQREGILSLTSVETAVPLGLYEPVFLDGDTPGANRTINPKNKWAFFVESAVNRYRPGGVLAQAKGWPQGVGVTVWEMWNEADLPFFWDASLVDYARLLKVGYLAAKHADPQTQVMFSGLAMWQQPDYYERVLKIFDGDSLAPGQAYFHDIAAVHNYSKPERTANYVKIVRQAMAKRTFDKPVWVNESGVPAWDDYPGPVWEPLSPLRATQEEQAALTIQSAFYALAAGADALFQFQLYDGCGNQPGGTDFPPHNGELCDANNNYNGLPCAGDAYGLYRNPADAACFRQHPQPESPRPAFDAYKILTSYVKDVEPYWQTREGKPIYTSTCPWSDGTQDWIALYQPATNKRIVGLWARCGRDETAVIEATAPDGKAVLITEDGTVQEITASNGSYAIPLPKATNRNPSPGQSINSVYGIGGPPSILIETDHGDNPPTATATGIAPVTATPTSAPVCGERILNGGFETNANWIMPDTAYPAGYSTAQAHTGSRSMRAGITTPQDNVFSYSTAKQTVTIPAGAQNLTLHFWLNPQSSETSMLSLPANPPALDEKNTADASDAQMVLILDSEGTVKEYLLLGQRNDKKWLAYSFDLSHYAGATIQVYFTVLNNGSGGVTSMYIDDVSLGSCADVTATATVTPTATATATATGTPSLNPTFSLFAPIMFNDFPLGITGKISEQGGSG